MVGFSCVYLVVQVVDFSCVYLVVLVVDFSCVYLVVLVFLLMFVLSFLWLI